MAAAEENCRVKAHTGSSPVPSAKQISDLGLKLKSKIQNLKSQIEMGTWRNRNLARLRAKEQVGGSNPLVPSIFPAS